MIVVATIFDAEKLTEIALEAKKYWGYSEVKINGWRADLTVTSKMFKDCEVYKYLVDTEIVGFYILKTDTIKKSSLEFLFVSPQFIKQSIGKQLLQHAIKSCIGGGSTVLNVLSDPNAKDFYTKYGFKVIAERKSVIPGRLLPEMELEFSVNM